MLVQGVTGAANPWAKRKRLTNFFGQHNSHTSSKNLKSSKVVTSWDFMYIGLLIYCVRFRVTLWA